MRNIATFAQPWNPKKKHVGIPFSALASFIHTEFAQHQSTLSGLEDLFLVGHNSKNWLLWVGFRVGESKTPQNQEATVIDPQEPVFGFGWVKGVLDSPLGSRKHLQTNMRGVGKRILRKVRVRYLSEQSNRYTLDALRGHFGPLFSTVTRPLHFQLVPGCCEW